VYLKAWLLKEQSKDEWDEMESKERNSDFMPSWCSPTGTDYEVKVAQNPK